MTKTTMIEGIEVLVTTRFEEAPNLVAFTITGEESDKLLNDREEFLKDVEEELKEKEYGLTEILEVTWYGVTNGKFYKEVIYKV